MKITFTEDAGRARKRLECIRFLNRTKVDVGLTSSASERSRWLMALHEHGAPGAHIPARPVIIPALSAEKAREAVGRELREAASAANAGDRQAMQAALPGQDARSLSRFPKTAMAVSDPPWLFLI